MSKLAKTLKRFVSDEQGLELVEYAVMTALIVAALVTAITLLSGAIETRFGDVQAEIDAL
jgi:Flp pilus assembly pilin Flp